MAYIGSRVKRKENLRLLRGIGKYVGDIDAADLVLKDGRIMAKGVPERSLGFVDPYGVHVAVVEVDRETGQPQSTSFMDYLLPTAMEMPKAQFHSTEDFPTPHNPLGVKGAGEGGTSPPPARRSRTPCPTRWEWK